MLFNAIAAKQMATAVLLIALTAPQYSSVSSFLMNTTAARETRPAWDALVLGIEIGITWANANMQPARNARPLYCRPNTMVMTVWPPSRESFELAPTNTPVPNILHAGATT